MSINKLCKPLPRGQRSCEQTAAMKNKIDPSMNDR